MKVTLTLPFPPSVNRIWRTGKNKRTGKPTHYLDAKYQAWKTDAGVHFLQQRARGQVGAPIKGKFDIFLTFDETKRKSNSDLDNRIKATLDLLQSLELIENDSLCNCLTAAWGPAEGVNIAVFGKAA